ncbi:hypothetical protein PHLCEN_2v10804 [Hermanssonia centrifuga]|uniref:Uncharacterized protein n=1 Tax=Hermanssonia centrifuga TaxID=98765 RepID=A0A2R6NM36_9APHY|nr:hypothetical protein PHLCEN_2v10804 [Hermanssonia centrifuga]
MSTSLPSTSLFSSSTPDPKSPLTSSTTLPADGKNARSNVGPIVGGVIGGVGGVAILGAAFLLFLRHRRDSNKIAPSAVHHAVSQEAPWFPPIEKSHMSQTIPTQPQDFSMNLAKLYNPDDPSTFPGVLNTATAFAPPAGNNTLDGSFTVHNDSHYSGAPEL